jgi:hypothetical protein
MTEYAKKTVKVIKQWKIKIKLLHQRWKCWLMKRGNSLLSAQIPSFSSCLDQVWQILFLNILFKIEKIQWSEEDFQLRWKEYFEGKKIIKD